MGLDWVLDDRGFYLQGTGSLDLPQFFFFPKRGLSGEADETSSACFKINGFTVDQSGSINSSAYFAFGEKGY
jgi:hypothetical protein